VTRKSPIKHPVKPHTRAGVHVHRYTRGDGEAPKAPRKVIGHRDSMGPRYTVTLQYGKESESRVVSAGSYGAALNEGLQGSAATPRAVTMRRR
jgi:hypothetical protein